MKVTWTTLAFAALHLAPQTYAQCPNEVALYNPNARTQTSNGTWFIVPVPAAAVQTALDGVYGNGTVLLSSLPTSDKSLFPQGFPEGSHPVLAQNSFSADIRMAAFQIDGNLLGADVYVPFVRRPHSQPGTVLTALLNGYLSGMNNNDVAGLVPATVSTLIEGYSTRLGQFTPSDAAYQLNAGNVLSSNTAWTVLPNPITGPGVYIEAIDFQLVSAPSFHLYTAKLFKAVLNQPAILGGINLATNMCQREQQYFNNATGVMLPRRGNVTFGSAADGAGPQATGVLQKAGQDGVGFFPFAEGFSACGQTVGFNPEDCDQAVKNIDPASLQ